MSCPARRDPGRRPGVLLGMTTLLVFAAAPTGALGLGIAAAGVGVEAGVQTDSSGTSITTRLDATGVDATATAGTTSGGGVQLQADAQVDAPILGATAEVSVGAAVSPTGPSAGIGVSTTIKPAKAEAGTGPGAGAPASRAPADPAPPQPGSTPAERAPATSPSARRAPSTRRAASPAGPAGAAGSAPGSLAQPSGVLPSGRSDGSPLREKLRAAAVAAARGIAALLTILAAFGLYLAVQRRLDRGPRMAWAGDGRHEPDDEMLSF